MKALKTILGLLLLGGIFFLGTMWNGEEQALPEAPPHKVIKVAADENNSPAVNRSPMGQGNLRPEENHTIRLFENAAPSVAYITTSNVRRNYYTRNITEVPHGTGSGFVWDKQGHIVTNYHVIQGADRAQVTLADQSTWYATKVGVAPEKDLAVLKIEAPANTLLPIPRGSSEDLIVGQSVYAIGNPFGLDQTLTTGIISALDREIQSVAGIPIRGGIQTDAAINPGNSGGPLLNSSGKLIGVNTAIYSPSGASAGIGFSIPVDVVNWIIPDLIQYGKVNRPTLGVELASPHVMKRLGTKGALVIDVVEGGAADAAGVRPTYYDRRGNLQLGDIIVSIDAYKIESNNDLILALEEYKSGDEVEISLLREDQMVVLPLQLDGARR